MPRFPTVALLAAALLLLGACEGEREPRRTQTLPVSDPAVEVETVPARVGSIAQRIAAPGSLVARRESRIGAQVHGLIERVFVTEGDRVEAGDPLFQIDPVPFEAALRSAEAGRDVARAERQQIEADLARARKLQKRKVVTEQEIDRLATSLAVAKAKERQADEAIAITKEDLERTLVEAPYAGSIARRLADEGTTALVRPQTIVLVLQETAELEAEAAIPESQLQAVAIGDRGRVFVEGLPEPIEATVSAVGDTIDPATRTYFVKMRVPNPDRALKAGVFAQVEILPRERRDALLVPREAIRTEDGRARVITVRDEHAVAVPVQVGVVSEDEAELLSGIESGTPVIVGEAARTIAPGMRVRVVNGSRGPAS
ncbi:MAG: efflux RND transporter periplasmic adaptor subunit [Myxococcota bacterium]|nr:efflux RND transporter periplasmic adaptor subunit [Myxococcota bacterium]